MQSTICPVAASSAPLSTIQDWFSAISSGVASGKKVSGSKNGFSSSISRWTVRSPMVKVLFMQAAPVNSRSV